MNASNHVEQAVARLNVATRAVLDERILADAAVALERATAGVRQPARSRMRHATFNSHVVRWAAVIAVTGVVVAGGVAVWKRNVDRTQPVVQVLPPGSPNTPSQTALRVAQRQKVDALYAARDVDGLIQALDTGRIEDRIRAARYLGEIADARAIVALSPLAEKWQGDPAENPFARAIRQIKARTRPGEPNSPDNRRSLTTSSVPGTKRERVLVGTITDAETGEPIPGVTVRLMSNASYAATTDSNGVYGFDRVDKDGLYYVRLDAPEYVTRAEWEELETVRLRAGEQVVRDYALERGGKLFITTLDQNARPLKGVDVYAAYVSDEMGKGPKHQPSRSDANGVVVIDGLRADTYLVMAAHPDFALAGGKVSLDEPKQVKSLVLNLKPGMDVAGVATCSDGLPAEGWTIEARPLWWNSVIVWPRGGPVAEDGTFLLQHILPGPHRLEVWLREKGGRTRGVWLADVNLPPESGVLDLKIPLPSPQSRASIAGTVRFTGSGSYEQGFRIHATSAAGHSGDAYVAAGRQDFVITGLEPGLYDLEIVLAGQGKEFKNIRAPSKGLVLEIAAPEIRRVSGRVVDAQTHRPVTSFALRVVDGRTPQSTNFGVFGARGQEYRRISDPNGAFEVRTYGPQCYVMVRADGYAEKTSDDLCRDGNEPVVIELGPAEVVRGVVVDEAGSPIEGVTVHSRYPRSADEPPITRTDKEGRFTIDDLPADEFNWWFVFRHPDYARALKQFSSGPNGIAEVKIVLSRGGTVEGCLYDGRGKPLGNTALYFMDEKDFDRWKQGRGRLGSVMTDGNGFYRIEHLPEELCYVFRDDPDNQLGVVQAVMMPARGRTRRLDIGGPWKVAGRLLQKGQPVANTQLLATYDAGVWQGFKALTVTDAEGRFAFYGLPTGQRSIYWAVSGGRGVDRWIMLGTFEFHAGVDLDLGDCELALAAVTVEVAVEDAAMPPETWSIVLEEYNERAFGGRRAGLLQPRGDRSGPSVFSHVPVGRFEALAQRQGYPTVRVPFEVKAGEETSSVLVAIPAGTAAISGQVIFGKDRYPYLMLRRDDQRITAEVPVGPDGTFRVKNLPPGRYIFGRLSYALERTSTLAEVTLAPQERKTISVDVAQADAARAAEGSLIVTVVTEDGVPLATPSVWLERAGRIIPPYFDEDDRKPFGGDPGPCMLHAEYPGFRPVQTTVELKSQQGRTLQDTLTPLVITMIRQ